MLENEFVQYLLMLFGLSEDMLKGNLSGEALFYAVLFSTEMLVLILSIIIWSATLVFRLYHYGSGGCPEKHVRRNEAVVHSYNSKDMKNKYKEQGSGNIISIVIAGFILPVLVIFGAILISLKLMEFHV